MRLQSSLFRGLISVTALCGSQVHKPSPHSLRARDGQRALHSRVVSVYTLQSVSTTVDATVCAGQPVDDFGAASQGHRQQEEARRAGRPGPRERCPWRRRRRRQGDREWEWEARVCVCDGRERVRTGAAGGRGAELDGRRRLRVHAHHLEPGGGAPASAAAEARREAAAHRPNGEAHR